MVKALRNLAEMKALTLARPAQLKRDNGARCEWTSQKGTNKVDPLSLPLFDEYMSTYKLKMEGLWEKKQTKKNQAWAG